MKYIVLIIAIIILLSSGSYNDTYHERYDETGMCIEPQSDNKPVMGSMKSSLTGEYIDPKGPWRIVRNGRFLSCPDFTIYYGEPILIKNRIHK